MNTTKKMLFLLTVAASGAACNTDKKSDDAAVSKPAMILPYTPSYSSSFEIGNPTYATTVVQGSWKDWEESNLDNMQNWVADSIVAYHSDNATVSGRDSLMARWKRGRAMLSSTKASIDAVIPVYSTDKKENWVLVWATEVSTRDGKIDTVSVMETWRINKDGKADLLYQFDRANRKK